MTNKCCGDGACEGKGVVVCDKCGGAGCRDEVDNPHDHPVNWRTVKVVCEDCVEGVRVCADCLIENHRKVEQCPEPEDDFSPNNY